MYHYKKIMHAIAFGKVEKPNGNCPECHRGDIVPSRTKGNCCTCLLTCFTCCGPICRCAWSLQNRCHFCGFIPPWIIIATNYFRKQCDFCCETNKIYILIIFINLMKFRPYQFLSFLIYRLFKTVCVNSWVKNMKFKKICSSQRATNWNCQSNASITNSIYRYEKV